MILFFLEPLNGLEHPPDPCNQKFKKFKPDHTESSGSNDGDDQKDDDGATSTDENFETAILEAKRDGLKRSLCEKVRFFYF